MHLSAPSGDANRKISDAVNSAIAKLYAKGEYKPEQIGEYRGLIDATNDVFNDAMKKGLGDNAVPREMRVSLQKNIFLFSGLKTHAQLLEASKLLLEKGKIKPYSKFLQDFNSINKQYNENYLEAEYEFAIGSSQSASKWADFEANNGRYFLQYRTAQDDRVRDSHQVLAGTTLASDDVFWNSYLPPNGWRCRCQVVEVLKDKYEQSDSVKANEKGETATTSIGKNGKNKLEIFRFNPGKDKIIFPENHPYSKLFGSKKVIDVLSSSTTIDLNEFVGERSVTTKDVRDVILKFAELQPENFAHGLETVKFLKSKSYLMQHSIKLNTVTRERVGKSTISISTNKFNVGEGFNPKNELMSGFQAIKDGKDLTFNQEYSFESLWHEILHAKTASTHRLLSSYQVRKMETINQFVARHTYPDFIKSFGGKSIHQKDILDNGYGYNEWIKKFRERLVELEIKEIDAVDFLKPHLLDDYTNLGEKMEELFNRNK